MAYGFEVRRSDGTTMVSSTDGVARLIYSADLAENYSGTINVPSFDSNLGFYYARMYPYMHYIDLGVGYAPLAESASWSQPNYPDVVISPSFGPTLSWNNTTKNLTITANAETEDNLLELIRYRYRLMMVHYK